MGLSKLLGDLINEHGSAAILRERLGLLRDQTEELEAENKRLTEDNQRLQTDNATLRQQLADKTKAEQFIEHRGVFFRRLANGNIQDEVYCSSCRRPMFALDSLFPFHCEPCNIDSGFTRDDLPRVLAEIA